MSSSQQAAGADIWLCWRWLLTSFRDISRVHKAVFHSALRSSGADQRLHIRKSCPALPGGAGTGVHWCVTWNPSHLQACGGWECVPARAVQGSGFASSHFPEIRSTQSTLPAHPGPLPEIRTETNEQSSKGGLYSTLVHMFCGYTHKSSA